MGNMSIIYEALLDLHADVVIKESLRKFREVNLYKEIDYALQNGDEELFIKLTNELKSINESSA
ncbi:IDEAL domain-containing protein [Chengkuizengella axinellae]|uniref:IDEAL domain-containing protein n=1 Tax=Chengkuizengella axinellae TaxID=3064388 RepID=A0ABT9IWS7_9BACL|nr:IDEAL domain-containing protein [Chengkuizengella sp. 2205SS18-9]MDP5273820.1 IDEAL domain-containing protein [Chengkuizengella sp. 2205SS18-9]